MNKALVTFLRSGSLHVRLTRAEWIVDALKVGVGGTSVVLEGWSAVACLTLIEIVLIALHFAHKKGLV